MLVLLHIGPMDGIARTRSILLIMKKLWQGTMADRIGQKSLGFEAAILLRSTQSGPHLKS